MKRRHILAFVTVLAAICLAGAMVAFAETIATQDYWVLTDGYNGDFTNNGQITVSYGPYGNYITEDVYDVDWPGTTGTTDQFFTYDAGRLIYHGARYVDSCGEWLYVPDTAQEFLPAAVEPGKSYTCTWSRREYQNGVFVGSGSDTYTITVSGPLTTTVPAGAYTTYEFSLINNWRTSSGSTGTTTYTYYVARDIGWVKLIRDGMTYELESYARPPSPPRLSIATSGITLSLSWTSEAGVTGFTLYYAPYPSASYIGSIDMGTQMGGSFSLWDGAAFYVAVQARNSYGSSGYSNIEHFVIDIYVTPPTVTTGSATSVTSTSATLTGTVNPNGSDTSYYFQYGTTTGYGSTTTTTAAGSGTGSVSASASLTGLGSGTTYHYRLAATNSGGTTYGADSVFSTTSSSSTYTNSLGQTFVLLPAGTFTMGSPSDEPGRDSDEGPQHQVTLTQPFYMQITEVTQAQWAAVMGSNPSYYSECPNCPVEYVSWNNVQAYITEMNKRGEGTYRLPTEAQWEYAARAGSTTAFGNGGITSFFNMNECNYDANLGAMGWYCYNSDNTTHPVAQKTANAWGLYDMHGNVWEWCQDWYDSYPSDAVTDPPGPSSGSYRVERGGSLTVAASFCRSAKRAYSTPSNNAHPVGFRLLRQP
jgi:formylglycine-generating enzyme required for sulfatase activity